MAGRTSVKGQDCVMNTTKSGIYAIINTKNNTIYIGSTVGFRKRWGQHRHRLHKGTHVNPHLQAAWNKYGEEAFEFGVLEYLDDPEELHLAEQFWMDIYREEGWELYNFGLAARHPNLGRHHSEEAKCKISKANTGNQYCLGRSLSEETRRRISVAKTGSSSSEEARRNIGRAHAKPYPAFIHEETGEIIPAGLNLSALCRERGLARASLCRVKMGKQRSCGGWQLIEVRL